MSQTMRGIVALVIAVGLPVTLGACRTTPATPVTRDEGNPNPEAAPMTRKSAPAPTPAAKTAETTKAGASEEERVADARKRHGDYYAKRMALFLKDTPTRTAGGTVFLGDSITEGLPLDKAFPGKNMINRGIGGDSIAGVIDRLDVSVANLQPSRVYLLIGINDLVWAKGKSVQDLAATYDELMKKLREAAPDARIIVESVLPVRGPFAEHSARIREFNATVRPLAEREGFACVDLHPWMADENGELVSEYTGDGVHLTLEGNTAWLESILPDDEFTEAAVALGPYRAEARRSSHAVDAVDPPTSGTWPGSRGPDQLILYTPKYGHPTTRTNPWGYEVRVENGVITRVGGNDSPIPADGFVVSGHGKAAEWMRINLYAGTAVDHDAKTLRFTRGGEGWLSPGQRVRAIRIQLLDVLSALSSEGTSPPFEETRTLIRRIHVLQGTKTPWDDRMLGDLMEQLGLLQKVADGVAPAAPRK